MTNRSCIFSAALLIFGSACATSPMVAPAKAAATKKAAAASSTPLPSNTSPREEKEFREFNELYSKRDYEGAIKRGLAFRSSFPRSTLNSQVANIVGLAYLLTKRPLEAITQFKTAVALSPKGHPFSQYVYYNLAKAQFEAAQYTEAQQTLSQINSQSLDRDNRIKFHYLRAGVFLKHSLPYEAAREVLLASRLLEGLQTQEVRANFSSTLDQALTQLNGIAPLEDLYKEFEDSSFADLLLFRLATREQTKGDLTRTEIHLQTLMARFPQSEFYSQAQALSRASEPEAPTDPMAIGVLLPMTGKFAKFGAKMLQAIELGFNIFDESKPDSKITLVIEDSGEEPEQAIKALDRLVQKHHVVALIGPLLTKGIDNVTRRAHELRVPMISLARQTGTVGDYVLPAGLTLQLQASEIARYAIKKKGLRKFAILSPRDRVGEDFMQYFWDAVESMGGEITGVESYNPGETDFRQAVDRLSGLYYTEARQSELDDLARLRETNHKGPRA